MKFVAISQRIDEIRDYREVRDALDEAWQKFFLQMDAALAPMPNEPAAVRELLKRLKPDAIVLSGGNNPAAYGGCTPQRDQTDEILIRYAVEHDVPLLGVCRGMQSVALYFGGTLKKAEGHVAVRHALNCETKREVNSYHGYAVDVPGEQIRAVSYAMDGTVEEIRHETYRIYGIMWHPERVSGFSSEDMAFIKKILRL